MEKVTLTAEELIRWCNKQKVTNRDRNRVKAYQKKLDKLEKRKKSS